MVAEVTSGGLADGQIRDVLIKNYQHTKFQSFLSMWVDLSWALGLLVESHIRYAVACWGQATSANRVLLSQKKALRILAGKPRGHSAKPIFKEWQILTLPALYILELATKTHCRSRNAEVALRSDIHEHGTRSAGNGVIDAPRTRLRATELCPSFAGISIYNRLPTQLKSLPATKFKTELKRQLLAAAPYTTEEFFEESW